MTTWSRGRGKLGAFAPLLGRWRADADSPMGRIACERDFGLILNDSAVQLDALWRFGAGADGKTRAYRERAIFGPDKEAKLLVWSFTSDGKRSCGRLSAAPDVHPQALCFESEMPAGTARQIYWPDATDGVRWAVESKTQKGWRRFTEHHYVRP